MFIPLPGPGSKSPSRLYRQLDRPILLDLCSSLLSLVRWVYLEPTV